MRVNALGITPGIDHCDGKNCFGREVLGK